MEDFKTKLKEIEEAVAGLEEPLKSKAIDKLLETAFNPPNTHKSKNQEKRERAPKIKKLQAKRSETIKTDEIADKKMIESINRTEHPEIHKLQTNIEKALFILEIMKQKDYDGLNPSQIKTILTEAFRIKSNLAAISMALINDKHYTEKEKVTYRGSRANKYRIMQSGEDYLKERLSKLNNHIGPKAEEPKPNLSSEDPQDNLEIAN
jgi:uncharacterized protein YdaT